MRLGQLEEGVFLARLNRFVAKIRTGHGEELAHLSNSGRLTGVMAPGRRVWVRRVAASGRRRTELDVVLMQNEAGIWVGVDTRLPPTLLVEAIERGMIHPFEPHTPIKREVGWGHSRFDLQVGDWLVETKSVTLVRGGTGLFPDAPTTRGQRHVGALGEAQARGINTLVAFIIQRCDARSLAAHGDIDPVFAHELGRAREAGVGIRAFASRVEPGEIAITHEVPVNI